MSGKKQITTSETKSSSVQTILDIWNVLANHASPDHPLTISEIAGHLDRERERQLELSGGITKLGNTAYNRGEAHAISAENSSIQSLPTSGKTVKRRMPQDIEAINTFAPHTVVCNGDTPTVLHTYEANDTLHIVIEDPNGTPRYEGDATVILKPGATAPIPEKTLNRKLPTLMEQFDEAGAHFPEHPPLLSIAGIVLSDGKYISALEHEADKADNDDETGSRGRSPTRKYYLKSLLSDAEWRILYDLIRVYPYISEQQTRKYLSVMRKIAPRSQQWPGERYAPKNDAAIQFSHIELLDQAIEENRRVNLVYGRYHLEKNKDGKLRPTLQVRTNFNASKEKNALIPFVDTVEPYAMMWSNGYYYLIAKTERGMRNLRMDRVMKVMLLQDTFEPDPNFDPYLYRDSSPVMYPGPPIFIKMLCPTGLLSTVTDFFSSAVLGYSEPRTADDGKRYTEVTLTASENGALLFAMQYANQVEILEPKSLRNTVADTLRAALEKYQ